MRSATSASIPLFPLHTVLFPGGPLRLRIFEPRYLDMVSRCMREDSGFAVPRATRANCLPALAQELRGRLARPGRPGVSSHPAEGGLTIRLPHPWLNGLLGGVSAVEAAVAGRLATRLPFGHSTMILARREV